MEIKKAERTNKKIRMGLFAPSGAGKTYSALLLAKGLCGDLNKVVVIDTENGSSEDYADKFPGYCSLQLEPPYEPQRYINAIYACEQGGFEVIIIDSISHVWIGDGGCLDMQSKYGGRYQDWAKVTPQWNKLVDKIRYSSAHIICCGRAKQEHALVEGSKGRVEVQKLGMGAQLRDGFEYELTVSLELLMNHHAVAGQLGKDRTGLFSDGIPRILTEEDGQRLSGWCNTGRQKTQEEIENEEVNKLKLEIKRIAFEKNISKEQFLAYGLSETSGLEELKKIHQLLTA